MSGLWRLQIRLFGRGPWSPVCEIPAARLDDVLTFVGALLAPDAFYGSLRVVDPDGAAFPIRIDGDSGTACLVEPPPAAE